MRKLLLSTAVLIGVVAAPVQAQSLGTIINSVLGGPSYGYQPMYSYPRSYGYSYGYQPSYGYSYGYQPSYGYQYGYQPSYSRSYGYSYPAYGNSSGYGCRPRRHHRNGVVYYTRGC